MFALAAIVVAAPAAAQNARDYISVVGSSTVYPFSTIVAERFGRSTSFKSPKVESTGSGGGFKLFCQGVGVSHPDITNSSRRIKRSEVDNCAQNGVIDIIEVKIGYDGIVIANSVDAAHVDLTRRDIFMALAKQVPDPESGELVANPYTHWNQIRDGLPAKRIEVMGPPPTSGTRDAFVELAMEGGCSTFESIKALEDTDKDRFKAVCHAIREDGAFVETGEQDNLIVQKLEANPDGFGIFGYSFLDQNIDKVQGASVDGVAPSFETVAEGEYPVSRPLYFYVKKAHIGVIPGIEGFLREFTSPRAWGEEGYLSDRGMIPLPDADRARILANVRNQTVLRLAEAE
ncbi:MAG: PstS family phosphate ABC transporter substrate-binding protein [Pseudomonadota bacterium]